MRTLGKPINNNSPWVINYVVVGRNGGDYGGGMECRPSASRDLTQEERKARRGTIPENHLTIFSHQVGGKKTRCSVRVQVKGKVYIKSSVHSREAYFKGKREKF